MYTPALGQTKLEQDPKPFYGPHARRLSGHWHSQQRKAELSQKPEPRGDTSSWSESITHARGCQSLTSKIGKPQETQEKLHIKEAVGQLISDTKREKF